MRKNNGENNTQKGVKKSLETGNGEQKDRKNKGTYIPLVRHYDEYQYNIASLQYSCYYNGFAKNLSR